MEQNNFRLRSLRLDIDQQLTNDQLKKLSFFIGCKDASRRLLDTVAKDESTSMTDISEALFNRRKITADNVNYLIERFDLVKLFKNGCLVPFSLSATSIVQNRNEVEQRAAMSNLFNRIDPQNYS
ncbi:unnamed protein product [Adineta steineri]|uniref:Uncharacterized protein n=1 Tax=Adineta steineri TaxID=433720 RepID=A0A819VU62_9BILA|nr:unnamed protein product [Adineta steineri]CAF1229181.1 unnamed protein product [Adineta steineri]CAF3688000.1 unnamed protein product [Adineta steineri]CAF4113997.1 unnamed protein product [Adineta steineri]